ncbi:MAG: potassium transporter TrkH [Alphaproteobacteria bacterium]|nr:potassium transporter TrkH [Alphaproteobacteria bacterium]
MNPSDEPTQGTALRRVRDDRARGILLTASLLPIVLAPGLGEHGTLALPGDVVPFVAAALLAASTLPGWVALLARILAMSGVALGVGWVLLHALGSPGYGLALMVGGTFVVLPLWPPPVLPGAQAPSAERPVAPGSAAVATVGLLLALHHGAPQPLQRLLVVVVALLPVFTALRDVQRHGHGAAPAIGGVLAGLLLVGISAVRAAPLPPGWAVLVPMAVLVVSALRDRPPALALLPELVLASPARMLVVSFAALCVGGSVLLALPAASASGQGVRWIDALFTAVSATCVTGLIVLDTPHDFSLLGQAGIALLIQFGGLGIMTFAAAAMVWMGTRLSVKHERATADMLGSEARADLRGALWRVLLITGATEAAGAVVLAAMFAVDGDGPASALWRGVFTSISAFCNAGFALQSDSLIPYQHHGAVLVVVSALIVLGGLGPAVVGDLPAVVRRRKVPLATALVLVVTALLLVVPTLGYLVLEWDHTLEGLTSGERFVNAWFQAVTLRTAGFNSVDYAELQPATWTLMIVAMFVGGSPGSTAGGVKTTTMGVLLLAVTATVRGRGDVEVAGWRLNHRTVLEAVAVVTVGVFAVVVGLLALQLTQTLSLRMGLFEVVSALATVGLSLGATGELDDVGKMIIILCMFAGRVGPLTLFVFLADRRHSGAVRYPDAAVPVG